MRFLSKLRLELIELVYIGMPVVRTDGRCTVTWLPNFLGWVVYHIFLPTMLRQSSAISATSFRIWTFSAFKNGGFLHMGAGLWKGFYAWARLSSRPRTLPYLRLFLGSSCWLGSWGICNDKIGRLPQREKLWWQVGDRKLLSVDFLLWFPFPCHAWLEVGVLTGYRTGDPTVSRYRTVSGAPVLWMSTRLQLLKTSANSFLPVKVFMTLSDLNHWPMTLEINQTSPNGHAVG